MDRKPILYISPLPPPYGGIATWTQLIFRNGLPNDHPLSLVDIKILGKRDVFVRDTFSLQEIRRFFSIIFKLGYQLLFKRPQLAHLNCALSSAGIFRDLICALLVKLCRVPLLSHFHGNLPDFKHQTCMGLSGKCLHLLMRVSSLNVVENQYSLNYMTMLNQKDIQSICVPNFVEDDLFLYQKTARETAIARRAIFAGGLTQTKGVLEILALARELPHIEFHLYGKKHLDIILYERNLKNIFLHGAVSHEALLKAMGQSDFLLFPSHTEGFPLTVVEAMAIGLPIIATSVGAIPEMVDHGLGGFLCAPKEVDALKKNIEILLNTPHLLEKMGKYNQQKSYTHYRYSIVVRQLQLIYTDLTKEHSQCVE